MKLHSVSKENDDETTKGMSLESFNGDNELFNKTKVLLESLSSIQKFIGETLVIKCSGSIIDNKKLAESFAYDIVLLKQMGINPIIVHGGNKKINEVFVNLNIQNEFINNLRVTDNKNIDIIEMVLSGMINKSIVQLINKAGGSAVGISGKDGGLIEAKKIRCTHKDSESNNIERILDLGLVGEPEIVNPDILFIMEESDFIPVISPICGGNGNNDKFSTYNVNADNVACAIATAISASKLIILTDEPGVLDKDGNVLHNLSIDEANSLIDKGITNISMVSKLKSCIKSVQDGGISAHILDERTPHVLLLNLFTPNFGTTIMD